MAVTIKGFNKFEQRLFNVLIDGEQHKIGELKRKFYRDAEAMIREHNDRAKADPTRNYIEPNEENIDIQAQSVVRNSLRRLVRDKWVEGGRNKLSRGTYRLSNSGKAKLGKGETVTASFMKSKRGRKPGMKKKKKVNGVSAKKSNGVCSKGSNGVGKRRGKLRVSKDKVKAERRRSVMRRKAKADLQEADA